MVDNKRLDELMLEKYPHIGYTAEQSDEFLRTYRGNLEDEDAVAWDFVEYISNPPKKEQKQPKTIQDYKNEFAELYSKMISEMEVEYATVSIGWTTKFNDHDMVREPRVTISF